MVGEVPIVSTLDMGNHVNTKEKEITMKKSNLFVAAALSLATVVYSANAAEGQKEGGMMGGGMMASMMKMMDANGDGTLAKDEFMKGHEKMFDRMAGKNGTIALNDMPKTCMGMMGQGGMMEHDPQKMPGHPGGASK